MAAFGAQNVITRRVTDDLIEFSGKTSPPEYTKFFLDQKAAEARQLVERMRGEAATARGCIGQLTAMIAEFQAMENQEDVGKSLQAIKEARMGEHAKLESINESIAEGLAEIAKLERNAEILVGGSDSDDDDF